FASYGLRPYVNLPRNQRSAALVPHRYRVHRTGRSLDLGERGTGCAGNQSRSGARRPHRIGRKLLQGNLGRGQARDERPAPIKTAVRARNRLLPKSRNRKQNYHTQNEIGSHTASTRVTNNPFQCSLLASCSLAENQKNPVEISA